MRYKNKSLLILINVALILSVGTFVTIIDAVMIDSQVTVIKNDCFERQAIGYRLKPSDVYKTLDVKTVPECQRECTKEEDMCKTFSFGIGVKGNASCEFSKKVIRETADLKPIGTLLDEDFDLYIKKLGCKLVIEQKPSIEMPQSDEIPTGNLNSESYGPDSFKPKPQFDNFPNGGNNNNKPPRQPHGTLQTTLIAVRPDPNRPGYTGLSSALTAPSNSMGVGGNGGYDRPNRPTRPDRPVNEPLNERPYYGGGNRPKPGYDSYGSLSNSFVNDNERPGYGSSFERPGGLYQGQSSYGSYGSGNYGGSGGYESNYGSSRPHKPPRDPVDNDVYYNRPEVNRPDFRPGVGYYRPIDPMMDEFKPNFDNLRPESWGGYERPDPMRDPIPSYEYGMSNMGFSSGYESNSVGRPEFDRPDRPDRPYETRPEFDRPDRPQRPQRPFTGYYRPSYEDRDQGRPNRPSSGYGNEMEFSRPGRPQYEYGNGPRPDVPPNFRPEIRPMVPSYEERPERPFDRPERPFDRPERPDRPDRPDRPVRPDGGYGQRPSDFRPPPDYPDERPQFGSNRPNEGGYDRPDFNERPNFDYERPRPQRPEERPPRPSDQSQNPYDNEPNQFRPNWDKDTINRPYDSSNPNVNYENVVKPVTEESDYGNRRQDNLRPSYPQRNNTKFGPDSGPNSGAIVSQSLGPNGEKITSIITEIKTVAVLFILAAACCLNIII